MIKRQSVFLATIVVLSLCIIHVAAASSPIISVDSTALHHHVANILATEGARNYQNPIALNQAAAYIEQTLTSFGVTPIEQPYAVKGVHYKNILARIGSGSGKKVVVGAHYDVCGEQDGADDNASGVAGLLEIARILKKNESTLNRTFELLAFYTLEEPPFFNTKFQGSYIHASNLALAGEKLELMIVLEMIGYYTESEKSQDYPLGIMKWFYPKKGNFVAVVGNFDSRHYVDKLLKTIKAVALIPCVKLVAPGFVPGIAFSDHANFWGYKYKALMITDSAFYRNRRYHTPGDVPETLSFGKMAQVVVGVTTYLMMM
jgi:hypothetical protein